MRGLGEGVLGLVVLAGVAAAAFAAQAADPGAPLRKPGLWKMTTASTIAGKPHPAITVTICMDPSVDKALSVTGRGRDPSLHAPEHEQDRDRL